MSKILIDKSIINIVINFLERDNTPVRDELCHEIKNNIIDLNDFKTKLTNIGNLVESIGMGFQQDEYKGVALKLSDDIKKLLEDL